MKSLGNCGVRSLLDTLETFGPQKTFTVPSCFFLTGVQKKDVFFVHVVSLQFFYRSHSRRLSSFLAGTTNLEKLERLSRHCQARISPDPLCGDLELKLAGAFFAMRTKQYFCYLGSYGEHGFESVPFVQTRLRRG